MYVYTTAAESEKRNLYRKLSSFSPKQNKSDNDDGNGEQLLTH